MGGERSAYVIEYDYMMSYFFDLNKCLLEQYPVDILGKLLTFLETENLYRSN